MLVRIRTAKPIGALKVELALTDGRTIVRDLSGLLVSPLYDRISKNAVEFEQVFVEAGTLNWPGGLDLDPDMVIFGGPPPAQTVELGQHQAKAN